MPRPKQDEMPISGPGVDVPRHKDIDRLADKFVDLLDERSTLSTEIGQTEAKLKEKLKEKGLTKYRYRDQEVVYKPGKDHVKIKTIKADSTGNGQAELGEEPPTE